MAAATIAFIVGCTGPQTSAPTPSAEPTSAPLAATVRFAPVARQDPAACPDEPGAFDTSNLAGAPQCTVIEPEGQVAVARGEVRRVFDPGADAVLIELDASAEQALEELTTRVSEVPQSGNLLAIIVRGEVISVPSVLEPLADGRIHIAGDDLDSVYTALTR